MKHHKAQRLTFILLRFQIFALLLRQNSDAKLANTVSTIILYEHQNLNLPFMEITDGIFVVMAFTLKQKCSHSVDFCYRQNRHFSFACNKLCIRAKRIVYVYVHRCMYMYYIWQTKTRGEILKFNRTPVVTKFPICYHNGNTDMPMDIPSC